MNDTFKNTIIASGVVFTLLLSGCATVPMAPDREDSRQKLFAPEHNKSKIYIYRNETFGGALHEDIAVDGKKMGKTAPYTYYVWIGNPGEHQITSYAENTTTLNLNTEPNKNYYVWQEMKLGVFLARTALHVENSATGKKAIQDCQLAKSN